MKIVAHIWRRPDGSLCLAGDITPDDNCLLAYPAESEVGDLEAARLNLAALFAPAAEKVQRRNRVAK